MKCALSCFAACAVAVLATSCTMSTPQARIERNVSLYDSLPPKHRELVSQGRIAKGMSTSAVYLALGEPSRKTRGFRENQSFERWDYTRMQPHYYNSFYSYFGRGYGRYGGRYSGFGFAPTIEYVPYRSASVLFHGGAVDSWEQLEPYRY